MKCKVCGQDLTETMTTCPNCGQPVTKADMDYFYPKKKNRGPLLAIVIIGITILVGVLIFFVIRSLSSPKNLMLTSLTKWSENITQYYESNVDELQQFLSSKDAATLDLKLELTLPEAFGLDASSINYHLQFNDYQNLSKNTYNMDFALGEDTIFEWDGMMDDTKHYFRLPEVMDSYYFSEGTYFSLYSDKNYAFLQSAVNHYVSLLKEKIDDKVITSSEVTSIKDQPIKAKKYTYALSEEDYKAFCDEFVQSLKNDQEFMESLSSFVGDQEEAITSFFETLSTVPEGTDFSYSIYVRGMNEVIGWELEEGPTDLCYYQIEGNNAFVITDDKDTIKLVWVTGDTDTIFTLFSNDEPLMDGMITPLEDAYQVELSFPDEENSNSFDFTIRKKANDLSYAYYIDGKMTFQSQGISFDIGIKTDIVFEEAPPFVQDSAMESAKDIDRLTEEELLQLETEINSLSIIQFFQGLFGGLGEEI